MHKKAVVRSLTCRARSIPSSGQERSDEMKHIISTLENNGYTKQFIIEASKPKQPSKEISTNDGSGNKFFKLPYVQGTSGPSKRILKHFGIKVALKPHQTIGNVFPKPKDPVPKVQTRAPIYKIPYGDCGKCYIDETNRQFATREFVHKKAI